MNRIDGLLSEPLLDNFIGGQNTTRSAYRSCYHGLLSHLKLCVLHKDDTGLVYLIKVLYAIIRNDMRMKSQRESTPRKDYS